MAHRGRLNVLANVMAKPLRAIFNEFKGGSFKPDDVEGSGDVKYHLGASSDRAFDGNTVHLSLTANPSHLEIVDPVVLGKVRAKQDQHGCAAGERTPVLPLLIHGDAAFAGQGVVAECFGLSGLKGHRTGGSIHFIINNQIGFTTDPASLALVALLLGRRADDRGADLPRERRQSGSRRACREDRDRVPPAVPEAGRHRHVLLPPLRPQRGRRADVHAAADVQAHQVASDRGRDLFEASRRTRAWSPRPKSAKCRQTVRAHLDSEFRFADGYKPNKADWLDGRWSGITRAEATSSARQYRRRRRDAEGHRPAHHVVPTRFPRPQDDPQAARPPPRR